MTERLDVALVRRGLAHSRTRARAAILAQGVTVNGMTVMRPSHQVGHEDEIAVAAPDHYVSRAAHKLLGALADSGTAVRGRVLDAGASTGGFTQVLLEAGAREVYAVDVGHGQLAPQVRGDPRVAVREGVNLRNLTLDTLGGQPVDLVVADVSFISLKLLLAPLLGVLAPEGVALLMVKPQFEVGPSGLDGRGVVRDESARWAAVDAIAGAADRLGWTESWRGPSRLAGQSGNVEYFLKLVPASGLVPSAD